MPDFTRIPSLDFGEILDIIQNPTSNLTAAALIGAAFIVILLILVVLAWMFLLTTDDHPPGEEARAGDDSDGRVAERASRKPQRARRKLPGWIPTAVVTVVVIAIVGLSATTARDSHCLGCHEGAVRPEVVESLHARCVECHEVPSPLSWPASIGGRIRMEASELRAEGGLAGESEAIVMNASCLRCHPLEHLDEQALASAESSGSVGVIMSHLEPVDAGMRCVECHGSVGAHVDADADGGHPTMRLCIDCHDDVLASADCATCHIADPVQAVRADPTPVAKIRLEKPKDCTGCHSVESCDACHGIRLPHSEEFIKGGHGYDAAFGKRRAACSRCHEGTWCLEACHPGGNWDNPNAIWGHPGDWVTRHAQFETRDCTNCHSKQFTCESCHDR